MIVGTRVPGTSGRLYLWCPPSEGQKSCLSVFYRAVAVF